MKELQKGDISFGHISRGDGKIYINIEIASSRCDMPVLAESHTLAGDKLPVGLVKLKHEGRMVVILPIIGVVQRCTVAVLDGGHNIICQAWRFISPNLARAESALNTARRDFIANLIRNCDQRPGNAGCVVRVDHLIRMESGGFNAQGVVMLTGVSECEVSGRLDIAVLGDDGTNALEQKLLIMKDAMGAHPQYPSCYQRLVYFSARVSAKEKTLVFWARLHGGKAIEGFHVMTHASVARYANDWDSISLSVDRDPKYDYWYRTKHAVGPRELELQASQRFPEEPLFSIVVPLYDTPTSYFREMAESVLRQSYGRFELILVNSTPGNAELATLVDAYAQRDDRVKCVTLDGNHGITENTNAGIMAAGGDFLCFLDHDDMITDDALFCYAKAINEYPDTDLLYSDEDNIVDGKYVTPYFKPDWNPDLLLGMNYVCHFLCVRKSIVDDLELPTCEYDGAQDYHMTWRVAERSRNIFHARRVLYHWRIHPDSTASGIGAKPYAIEAGRKAIESHLERCGIAGVVKSPYRAPDRYEVEYDPADEPLISILIPNKDCKDLLSRCVTSILEKSDYGNYEIVIIENNSEAQETFEYYEGIKRIDSRIRVIQYEGPFNFAKINNFGARNCRGEYYLMLNNDTEVISENWLRRMLSLCMREGTGVVGAKLLYPDGTIQHAGVIVAEDGPVHLNMHRDNESRGYYESLIVRQNYSAVTGACLMTKRSVFERVGGLDERFVVDYNDIDYCLAVREAGYYVVFDPGVELYHYESVSRGFHATRASVARFREEQGLFRFKWAKYFVGADPYGNPNFEQSGPAAIYHHCQS